MWIADGLYALGSILAGSGRRPARLETLRARLEAEQDREGLTWLAACEARIDGRTFRVEPDELEEWDRSERDRLLDFLGQPRPAEEDR